ncbi:hypothetical protein M427DRAFT_59608 [Gonapodya prolifera JEL478]|uniref:UBX domain-containing protein n=1 Tax=Gonapodya prolifera (strain JEL478) TaxID=1344416 RepID=A0A139A739_GONPJ|nr:hypothetical protein M427DRAFT_59608 [Gonapodya prolifera JEL478]|eukprot:KXS12468.1 hypothetical protein M427DRAFT_59608 [Gonapodya prolifera JEL478]
MADDDVSSEDILQFCEMAGCDPEIAASYLKVSNNDLERALGLFFETGGAPLDVPPSSSSRAPDLPGLEDDNPYSALPEPDSGARSRRNDGEGVRAPIARTMDTLVGGGGPYGMTMPPVYGMGRGTGSGSSYPTIGNAVPEAFRDFEREAGGRSSGAGEDNRRDRLADLFKPPTDIMFPGEFDAGRLVAQQKAKWILVNIQDPTEFQCQVLNRDIWSSPVVKEAIKENFIFMQFGSASQEGQKYTHFYKAYRFPHVAIIDPRTGEKVVELKRLQEATDFVLERYEFTDNHSLMDFKRKPATPDQGAKDKKKKLVSEMSEEEQLLAAMQASLGNGDSGQESVSDVIDVDVGMDEVVPEPPSLSVFARIASVEHPDPPDGKDTTRVQIRLPDGRRVVKRVRKADPVRYLFEHAKATIAGANDKEFELVSPTRLSLIDFLDSTITEAKLEGAAIMLTFTS